MTTKKPFTPTCKKLVGLTPYILLTDEQKKEVDTEFKNWPDRIKYKFEKFEDLQSKKGRTYWAMDTGGKIPIL